MGNNMASDPAPTDGKLIPPASFFDFLIRDISADAWIAYLEEKPILKSSVLEGFSFKTDKIGRLLTQPQIIARLRRAMTADDDQFTEILELWGTDKLSAGAFIEMLDRDFLLANWDEVRNFLGPERLFAALFLLGGLEDDEISEKIAGPYWERHVGPESVEPVIPVLKLWREFLNGFPQADTWVEPLVPNRAKPGAPSAEPEREDDRLKKVRTKLENTIEEATELREQLEKIRKENEDMKKSARKLETDFDGRLNRALAEKRAEWFSQYRESNLLAMEEAHGRLEDLFERTDRAFELQKKADGQYGFVAAVRRGLLELEARLKEIERINSESLVVHQEVHRVKELLLKEKKRLLALPGIGKVLRDEPNPLSADDILRRLRFVDPLPGNLSRVTQLMVLVNRMASLGFLDDPQPLVDEIRLKKRQILEVLYSRFPPPATPQGPRHGFRTLDDFVKSGGSKQHDLYIDGYNILLVVRGNDVREAEAPYSLTEHREDFIAAVCGKSGTFRRITLVFDGVEDSRDRRGNVDIVYTDKSRGTTADSVIIREILRRKDGRAVLATADAEIIRATESRLFAVIEPLDFYTFVFDSLFPEAR